jgi:phage-related minor tail protein
MAASGAWDAMLNVGRADSGQDKFNALAQQKERLEGLIAGGRKFDPNSGRDIQPEIDKVVAAMAAMQDERIAQQKLANQQATTQAAQDAGIALSQQADSYASAEVKRAKAIAKAHGEANDAIAKAELVQDADLRAKLIANAKANEQAIIAGLESKGPKASKGSGSKSDPFGSLTGLVRNAQLSAMGDGSAQDNLLNKQSAEILKIVDAGAKLIASGQEVTRVQAEVAVGVAAVNERYAKQAEQLKAQNVVAIAQYQASLDKQNDALQRTITSQIDKIGMGDKEYAQQQKINELYVKSAEALTQLQLKRDGVAAKGGDTSVLDANISALQANTDTQVSIVQRGYREMDAARADWTNGLNSALDDYLDRASDVAG